MKIITASEILNRSNNSNIFRNIVSQGKRRIDLLNDSMLEENNDVMKELDVEIYHNNINTRYFVGDLAVKEGRKAEYIHTKDKLNSEFGRATFLTALALMTQENNQKFIVGTGLPVMDHDSSLRNDYSNVMGKHKVKFYSGPWEGVEKEFEILGLRVYAQGMGIFFDNVIDDTIHEIDNHPFYQGFNAIIDVGSQKSNFVLFEEGRPIRADSLEHGMNDVLNALVQTIEKNDLEVPSGRDEDLLKRDELKGINLKDVRENELKVLSQFIKDKADDVFGSEATFIENIYVAGGAADLIFNHLPYKEKTKVKYPQFANARGFCKAATGATLQGKILDKDNNVIDIEEYNNNILKVFDDDATEI